MTRNTYLWNSSAAALTDLRSARSSLRKTGVLPVALVRSSTACAPVVAFRAAIYTFAPLLSRICRVCA
jgi:hypothetical protein